MACLIVGVCFERFYVLLILVKHGLQSGTLHRNSEKFLISQIPDLFHLLYHRCKALVVDIPSTCHICKLTLVSSPHLARSYHHLFPVNPFEEIQPAELTSGKYKVSSSYLLSFSFLSPVILTHPKILDPNPDIRFDSTVWNLLERQGRSFWDSVGFQALQRGIIKWKNFPGAWDQYQCIDSTADITNKKCKVFVIGLILCFETFSSNVLWTLKRAQNPSSDYCLIETFVYLDLFAPYLYSLTS